MADTFEFVPRARQMVGGWELTPIALVTWDRLVWSDLGLALRPRACYWIAQVQARNCTQAQLVPLQTLLWELHDGAQIAYRELTPGNPYALRQFRVLQGSTPLDVPAVPGETRPLLLVFDCPFTPGPRNLQVREAGSEAGVLWSLHPPDDSSSGGYSPPDVPH